MKTPIVVQLTEVEHRGHIMAGNAPEENIHFQIELVLSLGGMETETAQFMAQKLTVGAISARQKIAEATRFEIKVTGVPKPSTLLKKPKAAPKKAK